MAEAIEWLSGWYNWPFLLAFAVGIIFILVDVVLGGVADLFDADADVDFDVDGPDLDIDADLDVGGMDFPDVDGDFDADVAAGRISSFWLNGLAWVGIGKVPASVLLEVMLLSFGSVGLLITAVAGDLSPWNLGSHIIFPIALFAAITAAPIITRAVGGFIARIIPPDGSTAKNPSDFIQEVGITSSLVTHSIGQIRIEATKTHPQTLLTARCHEKVEGNIPRGEPVVVMGYDSATNIYIIMPATSEEKE